MIVCTLNVCLLGFAVAGFWCGQFPTETVAEVSQEQPVAKCFDIPPIASLRTDCEFLELQNPKTSSSETLDDRLEQILQSWEAEAASIETLSGGFTRMTYDEIKGVERWATGTFYYAVPNKVAYSIRGQKVLPGTESRRRTKDGKRFQLLENDTDERWVNNGREIFQICDRQRTFEKARIAVDLKIEDYPIVADWPEKTGWSNWFWMPLPHIRQLLVMDVPFKSAEATRNHNLALLKETETEIFLSVRPRPKSAAFLNYQEATLILTKPRYLTKAVRIVHSSGDKKTVYVFDLERVRINPPVFESDQQRLKPSLGNYKRMAAPTPNRVR